MADVVASSLVEMVCKKMGTELMKEYGLLSGADKELKKLEGTFNTIRDVLDDAEARQVKGKALTGWLRRLKDVAFEIDDLLDDAKSEAVKSENKKKSGIIGKVRQISSIPNSVKFKSTIAHRAKGIREKLDEIAAERSKFHLQANITTESNREDSKWRESCSSVVAEVYGREKDKENIIKFLINSESSNHIFGRKFDSGGQPVESLAGEARRAPRQTSTLICWVFLFLKSIICWVWGRRHCLPKEQENGVGVMAIVGMGGLGKTTIAQLIYNDKRVTNHFDKLIWVSVNNNFDVKRITNTILESISESKFDSSLELLQRKLKERLGGRRFLLVLDDVWNENSEKWDQLKRALLTIGAHGIKVIVTTRSTRVASIMGTVEPYILTGLSEEDCWLLFERRAFSQGTSSDNSNLVTIGKQIVKKCGGVPLAAKVIGSLMQFKRSESEWLAIRDNDIWNLSNVKNEILPSLMLSYMNLPSHLKQCFTYCALFPKNEHILTSALIQLWIAEGFIHSNDSRTELKDIGEEYVGDLLSRSLFQACSHFREYTVCMHDLIYDLANYVAGEECSSVDIDGITIIRENTRYSSFVCKNGPLSSTLKSLGVPPKLRTLYVIRPLVKNKSQEQEQQKDFLNAACSNFILLRALYLRYCRLKELPTSLRNLRHLRYLDLSRTKLEILPSHISHLCNLRTLNLSYCNNLEELSDSIGELYNLIILDLTFCDELHSLPMSIVKLTNLKLLRLKNCSSLHELPSKIGEMRSLVLLDISGTRSLECIPCGIGDLCYLRSMTCFVPGGKTQCSMRELGNLDLKDELEIKYLENVKTPEEAKEAKLICKNDLRKLSLVWGEERESIDECIDIPLVEQIIENLQPPSMLLDLEIWNYLGKKLPTWLMDLQLPNLVSITLASWSNCEILPEFKKFERLKTLELFDLQEVRSLNSLGQVPSLEVLTLEYLPLIKCLGGEFYGGDVAFTRLVELNLKDMPELEEWSEVAAGFEFFPRLVELQILECPKLKKLPSTFSTVRKLKVTVDDEFILSSLHSQGITDKRKRGPFWELRNPSQ